MDPTKWTAPYPVVVIALFVIVLLRASGTYLLGRLSANAAHRTRARKLMDSPGYQRAVDRINRWGAPAVSVSFLTVGVQTLINFAAGATRMPVIRYGPAVLVGSVLWAFLYASVGFVGLEALTRLYETTPAIAVLTLLAAVTALAGFLAFQFRRRTGGEADGPDEG